MPLSDKSCPDLRWKDQRRPLRSSRESPEHISARPARPCVPPERAGTGLGRANARFPGAMASPRLPSDGDLRTLLLHTPRRSARPGALPATTAHCPETVSLPDRPPQLQTRTDVSPTREWAEVGPGCWRKSGEAPLLLETPGRIGGQRRRACCFTPYRPGRPTRHARDAARRTAGLPGAGGGYLGQAPNWCRGPCGTARSCAC